ncbi:pentatricopeptide repeat-containing protein At4g33170-like [Apium graveolens]|uniref:pentatricopeptide repeat-containing protein At4g33170-like n=1 Tax=Apium graveolens TaxID=4045 RepID=UPI003D795F80
MKFQNLSKHPIKYLHNHLAKDPNILAPIIKTYTKSKQLKKGTKLHAQLISTGSLCTFLSNHFILMYCKCGHLHYAAKVFDEMPQRNLVSWTALISGFSQNLEFMDSVVTFREMVVAGESPNEFAFSSVLQACTALELVNMGEQVHCLALKSGLSDELYVGSNLADLYSKCGLMGEACLVFEEMPWKDEVSWTAMIDGYITNGDFEEALLAFRKMMNEGMVVDQHVLSTTLRACGALKAGNVGNSLYSIVLKLGYESHIIVGNALIDMYSKMGDMESASSVFGTDFKSRDVVSFTSLIDGFVEVEEVEKAVNFFVEMHRQSILPNEFTFSSLIKACANQAALEQGIQLHALVIKLNVAENPFVYSSLIEMYGKCGLFEYSVQVFEEISMPIDIAWNSLLGVFAQHGSGRAAMKIFDMMIKAKVKPNAITFGKILTGCSHAGLVEEGLSYFYSMEKTYGVTPGPAHYSCVIDLLGRAGRLKEAEEFISNMPFEPNAFGWCSFLAACRIHNDMQRGKFAAKELLKIEPENSGAHVLLSNIYAKGHHWDDVKSVRRLMKDGNVKKLPGYSWVDVDNKTHVFGADDWSHPRKEDIDKKLDSLLEEIVKAGYIPYTDSISLEVEDSIKVKLLHRHSERIAIAFALISMPSGKPIIIKKNIRVCLDCHSAIKFISKVTGRKIIVRDNSRFHHFVDGSCSCGDYW